MLWAPFIIAIILILLGLAGIFIPGLPDFIFIFLAVLIYGIWTGFEKITIVFILIVLGLVVLSYLFDWLGMILGAKKYKATNYGIIGAVLGSFLGIFIGGLAGMIGGAFLGVVLFEIVFAKKDQKEAARIGLGTIIGIFASIVLKFVLAGIIIVWFLTKIF